MVPLRIEHDMPLNFLLVSSAILALGAPSVTAPAGVVARGELASELARRILWDAPSDGGEWAYTQRYKAAFTTESALFVPILGPEAPRNTPVGFGLRSVRVAGERIELAARVQPSRIGDRVVYERGPVREVYDVRPGGMEQSFEFDSAHFAGEIVLEIAVESSLERASDADGLLLHGEHGSVRYSNAIVFDARRDPHAIPTRWSASGIELVVPAEIAKRARGRLVIDPVITTYGVAAATGVFEGQPDVAFDRVLGEQGVVVELPSAGFDRDVLLVRLDATGSFLGAVPIDVTTSDWSRPRVAYNHATRSFLCVAQVANSAPPFDSYVVGRTYGNALDLVGAPFDVTLRGGNRINADVGGDSTSANVSGFCVVWEKVSSVSDREVECATIDTQGTVGQVVNLSGPGLTLDGAPSISKWAEHVAGADQTWCIAWTRNAGPGNADVLGAHVNASGVIVLAPFPIDATTANTFDPSVSSLTSGVPGRWLVAYARSVPPGNADLHGKLFEGDVELDSASLTQLVGSPASEVQNAPSVDSDGHSFVVAWIETAGGQRDAFVATFADVGGRITLAGAPEALGATSEDEDQLAVCAARPPPGLASRSLFTAWRMFQAGSHDVVGATYSANAFASYCSPGVGDTIPCPCGNAPVGPGRGCRNSSNTGGALLLALGNPDADSVVLYSLFMRPNGACIFLQGDQVDLVGVPFGDGVRCIDGQLLRLALRFADPSGNVIHPGAGDTPLGARNAQFGFPIPPGAKRGYQVYYRDAQNFACPTTFNVTNAVQVQW